MSVESVNPAEDYSIEVTALIEKGTSFSGPISSWVEWRPDAYQLYQKPQVSLEKVVTMRRTDGQVRALVNLLTLPIRLALRQGKWVAPSISTGDAEAEVEFANLLWSLPPALGGMSTSKSHIISQMCLAITDGFAPFELVSHVPTEGPLKGKKTLRKIAYRDPRTVTILQDEHGGYAGFRQRALGPKGIVDVSLSSNKTVLFTVNGHENPHYGISFLESAYPHYEAKMKWYYISEMAGQFAAVPGRLGTVPKYAKTSDVQAFMRNMADMYFNTTMVMKDGYKVEAFNTSSGFDFMKYIDHHNMMMAKSVLASFFESDQRTVLVENSTEDASADIFLLAMETLAEEFADTLTNHVMPKYIRENFKGSTNFPVFKPGPLSDSARRKIQSLFEKVSISGILNITPEMVRELEKHVSSELGLDVPYSEIEAREQEAATQAAEIAEAQAVQMQQESIEAERAAEGGLPNSLNPTSGATSGSSPVAASSPENLENVELTHDYLFSLDRLVMAAQKVLVTSPLEDHSVDEGVDA